MANIDHVHLPSQAFVGGVYRDEPSIPAEAGMQVNPVYAVTNVHAAVTLQPGQRHEQPGGAMVSYRRIGGSERTGGEGCMALTD